jgi:hypothetical protein
VNAQRIASTESTATAGMGMAGSVLFTAVACALFYIFAVQARGEWLPILVAGMFVAAGVAAVWASVQRALELRRFGVLHLELAGEAPAQGGTLHALLDLRTRDVPRVRASLVAFEWRMRADGRRHHRRQVERARHTLTFPVRGGVAEIRMRVPRLPEIDEPDWRLEVHAGLPGVDLNRTFPLSVAAGAPAAASEPAPEPEPAAPEAPPEALPAPVAAPLLIAANLVPLAGVLMWDWRIADVVILYWIENLVIGAFNVLRILLAAGGGAAGRAGRGLLAAFFAFHYGFFCFVHGVFLAHLFAPRAAGIDAVLLDMLREPGLLAAIAALVASHGYSFVRNYLGRGEHRNVDARRLMSRPYGRIVLVHVFVIAGGFLVQALESPVLLLVLFVALKTAIDYAMHRRERRALATPPAAR